MVVGFIAQAQAYTTVPWTEWLKYIWVPSLEMVRGICTQLWGKALWCYLLN